MFERKNKKRYLSLFLVLVFVFSPVSFSSIATLSQAVSVEEITGYQEWNQNRTIDRNVIVKPGATLVIGKGVEITFVNPWIGIQVNGNLFINGTVKEPTSIKSNSVNGSFSITTGVGSNVNIRNAEMSNGGSEVYMVERKLNTAMASSYSGVVQVNGGNVDIQNTTFRNNRYAVIVTSSTAKVRVNRSRFIDNYFDVGSYNASNDFRYNWWGSPTGPGQTCYTYSSNQRRCYFDKIYGNFDYSKHLTQEFFKDPVIIIPGILGSWKWTDSSDLVVDPILGLYDPLIQTLIDNGYEKDKNLFIFPYEWRASNVETAKLLRTKIEEIKTKMNWPKVDIVAHSMGGLVAREYIETLNGGSGVDQLITLGTPQNGSPKSYMAWEAGDLIQDNLIEEFLIKKIFQQEAEENGYPTIFDYLTKKPIPSVRELLPVYSYLRDQDTSNLRSYPTSYPRNTFLEKLKEVGNISKLRSVEFTNIVGKISEDRTITALRVSSPITISVGGVELDMLWGHGKPDGYDDLFGDQGVETGSGDGTVPFSSASDISADETIELPSAHNKLPTDAAKIVFNRLTGMDAMVDTSNPVLIHSILMVPVFSPIDIQIVSPSQRRVGKNFDTGGFYNEIHGAFYTGSDAQSEFVTIPNPEDGEYKILTQGTGSGEYRIEAMKIMENPDTLEASESIATIRGTAMPSIREEQEILIEGSIVTAKNMDIIPPTTEVSLSGAHGADDWFMDDVTVILSAEDDEDGVGIERTEYSIDGGTTWIAYAEPLVISREGIQDIRYFSIDKAGNKEDVKTQTIKIDKTAPEAKIVFNADTQKLDIIGIDNLGQNVRADVTELVIPNRLAPSKRASEPESRKNSWNDWIPGQARNDKENGMMAILTDEAGHTLQIHFSRYEEKNNRIVFRIDSLSYDGIDSPVSADMKYKWSIEKKGGGYRVLSVHANIGETFVETHYRQKENMTAVMTIPKDLDESENDDIGGRPIKEQLSGMAIPAMLTEQGKVKIVY